MDDVKVDVSGEMNVPKDQQKSQFDFKSITSPLILLVLAAVGYVSHRIKKTQAPVSIFGHQLSTNHQIMVVNIASAPILFIAGAGAALFWTLGASCFVISLHAIFYNIDAIVTEENEGFLAEVV